MTLRQLINSINSRPVKRQPKVGDSVYWVSSDGDSIPGEIVKVGKGKVKAFLNCLEGDREKWITKFQYQDELD